jgi:hypothetical protein
MEQAQDARSDARRDLRPDIVRVTEHNDSEVRFGEIDQERVEPRLTSGMAYIGLAEGWDPQEATALARAELQAEPIWDRRPVGWLSTAPAVPGSRSASRLGCNHGREREALRRGRTRDHDTRPNLSRPTQAYCAGMAVNPGGLPCRASK